MVSSAHDVSVVLHEYGHALLDDVAGNILFFSTDGRSLHEGFADYIAVALEESIGAQFENRDLHTEFMGEYLGLVFRDNPPFVRTIIEPPFDYPDRTDFSVHRNGELFSSAFYELDRAMGRDAFMVLIFEALARMADFDTPTSLVQAFTEADQVLNESANADLLDRVLGKRKFDQPYRTTHDLAMDQTVTLKDERTLITINPQNLPQPFGIEFGEGFLECEVFIGADYESKVEVSSAFGYDIAPIVVASEGATFLLEEDSLIFLSIHSADEGVTVSLNPDATLVTPIVLAHNVSTTMEIGATYELNGEVPFDSVLLWFDQEHTGYQAFTSTETLPTRSFDNPWTRSHFIFDTTPHPFLLDVAFDPFSKAFMSFSAFSEEVGLRWTGINRTNWEYLVFSTPTPIRTGGNGLAGAFVDFPQGFDSVSVTTDADTSFYAIDAFGEMVPSTLMEGVHTIHILRSGDSFFIGSTRHRFLSFSSDPIALFAVTGDPGKIVNFEARLDPGINKTTLSNDLPVSVSLAPGEMRVFRSIVPNTSTGFDLRIESTNQVEDIAYVVLDHNGHNLFGRNATFELEKTDRTLASNTMNVPRGRSFSGTNEVEIWALNTGDQTADMELEIDFSERTVTKETLPTTGTVPLTWYGFGPSAHYAPFELPIDPTAKRLRINFTPVNGSEDLQLMLESPATGYRFYTQGLIDLGIHELGNFEAEQITKLNLWFYSQAEDNLAESVQFEVVETPGNFHSVITETTQVTNTLAEGTRAMHQLDPSEPIRGIIVGMDPSAILEGEDVVTTLTGDTLLLDGGVENLYMSKSETPSWISHMSQTPLQPLPDRKWTLDHSTPNLSFFFGFFSITNIDFNPIPFDVPTEVALLPMHTDTQLPPTVSTTLGNVAIREVMAINPSDEPLQVTWNNETLTIPADGFIQRDIAPEASLDLQAEGPLALFERMSGEAWETLTAPSPYGQHDMLLPHLPPASSPWEVYAVVSNKGSKEATLTTGSEFSQFTLEPGVQVQNVSKDEAGSWSRLTTTNADGALIPELSVSGTQYWTLDGHYAAEPIGVTAGPVLHVPHFPKVADWWVGMTLANPNSWEMRVTIAPYDSNGLMFEQVRHLSLPGRQSVTGLLETFIDGSAVNDVQWLRIHSEEGNFAGLCFIGTWRNGDDVAAFSLPTSTASSLLLPGPNTENWYGVAITNTVSVPGSVTVSAIAPDGSTLASFEQNLAANEKLLFTGSERFPELGHGDYYIHVQAQDIRISGLVIGGNGGKALSAQTPILLP
jgi:hypothetical protein